MKRLAKCLIVLPENMGMAELITMLTETDLVDFVADGQHELLFELKEAKYKQMFGKGE